MKNRTLFIIISIIFVLQSAWIYYLIKDVSKIDIIKKEDTIILTEADFIKDHIKEIQNSVLYITDLNSKKESSGLILTSDGLVLTLNSNVPKNSDFDFKFLGKSKVYEIRKRDAERDLALVQIGEVNLKPCSFAQDTNITLGDQVYILGLNKEGEYIFGEGVVKNISEKYIQTNIYGDSSFNGAPIFNEKGDILGIGRLNNNKLVDIILINDIKDFLNL